MKFFARYISKAAIIIQKNENLDEDLRYKFCFDNLTIGMKNAISNNYDKQNNIALEFITEGDFQNKAVFLETSRIQIDVILSLISLSTIRYCSPVQLTNVTEVIDNKDRFPTAYYVDLFNDDTTCEIIHFFDPVIFEEIFTQFNSYQDVNLILRSITWFRKGLNEEYINKFVTFWFGLEVLKEIPSTIELSKSNIDNKWKKVETIFENYLKIQDFYHIKNDLKEKLFDGTHELDMSFKEEIEKYLPVLQKALLIGILMELRINGDIIDKIIKFIRAEDDQRNLYLVLIGELEKFPQSLDNLMDDFPIIEMKTKHTVAPTISQNFKTYYFNGEYLFSNFKDNQFNLSERQLWSKQRPTELEKTFSSIRLKDSKSDTLKVSFDAGKHKTNNYEKSVIFKPWMKTLNEGKAAGKISYLFLADRENERENLQLFGGLCYSPAGHILFYPGFEYEYLTKFDDSLQISSKSTYIIDHFTLLKGASKWHVTGFDETGEKKHKFDYSTQMVMDGLHYWFGLNIQRQAYFENVCIENELKYNCPSPIFEKIKGEIQKSRLDCDDYLICPIDARSDTEKSFYHFDFFCLDGNISPDYSLLNSYLSPNKLVKPRNLSYPLPVKYNEIEIPTFNGKIIIASTLISGDLSNLVVISIPN